jgi:aminoglycoside phosphotransferase (APT) family kinase protein
MHDALFDALPEAALADALLAHLRDAAGMGTLAFATAPERVLGGFDTLIYRFALRSAPAAFAGPLIVRVFRDAQGPERARYEASIQNAIAALGFPVPAVLLTCTDRAVVGGAFNVMPSVQGRVMLDAFFGPQIVRMPALLARLHARLHRLDADAFVQRIDPNAVPAQRLAIAGEFRRYQDRIAMARLTGLQPGLEWLMANPPPAAPRSSICHGDFHPLNVIIDATGVTGVLDWAWVKVGDPAWDVGATTALMAQGPIDMPAPLRAIARQITRWVVAAYLRAYAALRPIEQSAVRYYDAFRCLGMLIESGEKRQAACGIIPPIPKPSAFDTPQARRRLLRRFRSITDLALAVPG